MCIFVLEIAKSMFEKLKMLCGGFYACVSLSAMLQMRYLDA